MRIFQDERKNIFITNISEISAIYFALLQFGYNFFSVERETDHVHTIQKFVTHTKLPNFFSDVKQNTCEVYPYWPRAAILETATFFYNLIINNLKIIIFFMTE